MPEAKLNIDLQLRDRATRQFDSSFRTLNKSAKKSEKQVTRSFGKMSDSVKRLTTLIGGVGLLFAFRSIINTALEFESAFAGVRKTVDATEDEFKQLSDSLIQMSREIPVAAQELAKIQEVAGQLGVEGVDNLTKFTKTIALIGVTTNIVGETGALQLARFLSILGESEDSIDRVGSVIVDLGNNFRTQEAEMLDLALNLASFGSQIGLTAGEVLAFSTAIKSAGGESQAASTAFQKVALKIKDAVITGNADLQKFADIAGKTGAEFKKAFQEDAANAIALFLEGLNRIDEEGGSVTQALNNIGLADVRLVREFGKVIKQTDVLRSALEKQGIAWEENNALIEEAEKRFGTTASKLQLAKNEFAAISIELGEVLLPAINKIIQAFTTGIEKVEQFSSALGRFFGAREENILQPDAAERLAAIETPAEEQGKIEKDIKNITAPVQAATAEIKKLTEENKKSMTEFEKFSVKSVDNVFKSFGTAFAQMIVTGKDFGESMKQAFTSMAMSFIAQVTAMIAQWLIFTALTAGFGGAGTGIGGLFSSFIPGAADGGNGRRSGGVLVGERGPELLNLPRGAQITPLENIANDNRIEQSITIERANFGNDQDAEDVFEQIADILSERRRATI